MPAFAAASYCFYDEDDKTNPMAEKIATFSIGQLAQILLANTRAEYKKHALVQIGKRALDPNNAEQLFSQGAIDAAIACLRSEDDDLLELATKALINISVDETSRDDIYDGGGIPLLVKLLQAPNENIQANAAWVLINLTNNDANKDSVREIPEAVPCLISLSQLTGNSSLQTYALKVLANLSESPTNQKMMADITVLVPLFKVLVTSRNMSLISYILYFFRNLTKSDEGKAGVRAAAGLKVFSHLLKNYKNPQVLGPVLVVLSNIADQDNIIEMLKLGVLQQLIPILQQGQEVLLVIIFALLQKIALDARTHKVLIKVLCDVPVDKFLAHQQPKVHNTFIELIQILCTSDQGLQELQSGPVFMSIMETFAGELMTSEAQESLLSILLSLAKTSNKSCLYGEHCLMALVAKASSEYLVVQQRTLHLLAVLALDPEVRIKIAKLGGLNKILAILANPEDHPAILTLALVAMNVMMMEARLRNVVIKTRRLRLNPLLQSKEPQVAAAAQKLLQSVKVALQNEKGGSQENSPQAQGNAPKGRREIPARPMKQIPPTPIEIARGAVQQPEASPKEQSQPPVASTPKDEAPMKDQKLPTDLPPSPIKEIAEQKPNEPPSQPVSSPTVEQNRVSSPSPLVDSESTPGIKRSVSLIGEGVTYKLNYGSEVKVLRVPTDTPWADLRDRIFAKFPHVKPTGMSIKYKDRSGDLITLESDEDLEFALELVDKTAAGAVVQIFLVRQQQVVPTLRRKQQSLVDDMQGGERRSINDLSRDVTIRIFSFLPSPKDLACASMACKQWSTYLNDQAVWKALFQRLHKDKPPVASKPATEPPPAKPFPPSLLAVQSMSLDNLKNQPPPVSARSREPRDKGSGNWKELLVKEQRGNELMSMHFQCTRNLQEHAEPITGVQFHRSGAYFFSSSFDGTAKVWETDSGAVVSSIKAHRDIVSSVLALDKFLFTSSWDRTVKVWELQGQRIGRCLNTLKHDGKVTCLQSSSSLLFTGSADKQVRIWDPQRGDVLQTLKGHVSDVSSLAYNQQDDTLLSGGNRPILVWDVATSKNIASLSGHSGEVNCIQADSTRILSGSWDKTVKLWDPRSWLCEQTMRAHTWPIRCLQYDEAQNLLVTGSSDKTIKVWDLRMFGECLNTLEGHTNFVCCISFVGKTLVSGSDDCTIRLWDLSP